MSKIFRGAVMAAVAVSLISGGVVATQAGATSYVCKYQEKSSSKKGTVIGAIAGGIIGSQVSKNERGLGTVGGAVIGGAIGSKVGKNHGKKTCLQQMAYRTETEYRRLPNGKYEKVVYRYVRE